MAAALKRRLRRQRFCFTLGEGGRGLAEQEKRTRTFALPVGWFDNPVPGIVNGSGMDVDTDYDYDYEHEHEHEKGTA